MFVESLFYSFKILWDWITKKEILMILLVVSLSGCATLKYRWKNHNGERSQAQMDKDWKDCYEYSGNRIYFEECVKKKGYYAEAFEE